MTRAKKGSTLIKKVKSTNYEITNVIPVNIHDVVSLKTDGDFKEVKATEIPIMDLASTGSTISKTTIEDTFKISDLVERKLEEKDNSKETNQIENNNQEIEVLDETDLPKTKSDKTEELTIDDFIEDFKL